MILTVNIGNTNSRICLFQGRRIARRRIISTHGLLRHPARFVPAGMDLTGAALASVVPEATSRCLKAIRDRTGLKPFVLDKRSRTGLEIRYDRSMLGADRVCDAVGARAEYPGDLIVLDFGTAVTANVVTREDVFLGGPILPGQGLMLESLHRATAQLPALRAWPRTRLLSRTTAGALQAGTFQLLCLGLEAMVKRIERETGRGFKVIATGGRASQMKRHIPSIVRVEPDLGSRGLLELLLLNRRAGT